MSVITLLTASVELLQQTPADLLQWESDFCRFQLLPG